MHSNAMLAQLPDPSAYASIGWLIVSLGALALVLNQGFGFVRSLRGEPPAEQLKLIAESLKERVDDLEKQREADLKNASDRRQLIYAEFRTQRMDFLKEIKDVYVRIDKDRNSVNEALRELPGELIATLRNTGVIKG